MTQGNNRTDQRHPAEMTPCPRCHGAGKVHAGPYICSTCRHGTSGVCARNHGTATPWKTCGEWKPVDAASGQVAAMAEASKRSEIRGGDADGDAQ